MNGRKLIAVLSAAMLLAACNNGGSPAASSAATSSGADTSSASSASSEGTSAEESSSSASESSSTPSSECVVVDADTRTSITIKDNIEIGIGSDVAFDTFATGTVSAKRSSDKAEACYTLSVVEGFESVVRVEGTKIIGLDEGAFSVLVVSGRTRKALHGNVVTDEKLELNQALLDAGTGRYSYDSELYLLSERRFLTFSTGMNTPSYKSSLDDAYYKEGSQTEVYAAYHGIIERGGFSYSYTYKVDIDGTTGEKISDPYDFEVGSGYSYSAYRRGYRDFFSANGLKNVSSLTKSNFTDDDGNVYYELVAEEIDEYGTTNIDTFLGGMFGMSDVWTNIISHYGSQLGVNPTSLAMRYDYEEDNIYMTAVDAAGNQSGFNLYVSDLSTAELPEAEDWLVNGEEPEMIEADLVNAFFDKMFETKTYTVNASALWFNPKTMQGINTPDGWKTQTGVSVRGQFESEGFVNATTVASHAKYVEKGMVSIDRTKEDPNYYWQPTQYVKDDIRTYTEHDGVMYSAEGRYAESGNTWSEPIPVTGDNVATNPWETIGMTTALFANRGTAEEPQYLLDAIGSVTNKRVDETTGDTMFVVNDAGLASEDFYSNYNLYLSTLLAYTGDLFSFSYDNALVGSWQDDYIFDTFAFSIDAEATTLTYNWIYEYSSSAYYMMSIEYTDLGIDKATEFIADLKFGDEPAEESSSEESSEASSEASSATSEETSSEEFSSDESTEISSDASSEASSEATSSEEFSSEESSEASSEETSAEASSEESSVSNDETSEEISNEESSALFFRPLSNGYIR